MNYFYKNSMKMTRRKLPLVCILLLLLSCGQTRKEDGWEVTIRGKVKVPQAGQIIITEMRQGAPQSKESKPFEDTIVLSGDGTFEKKIKIKEPGYYQLDFFKIQIVNLILDKDDLEVTVDGNAPTGFSEIKGSRDLDLIADVQKMLRDAQGSPETKAIEAEFQQAAQQNNEAKISEIQQKYLSLMDKTSNAAAKILKAQPPSLGLIHLLRNAGILDPDKFLPVFIDAAEKFRKEWPEVSTAKDFVTFVEKLKRTAVGQPAPEISLPDPDGKILTLSSFKGKYVLVDFWAKWCGPCRRENPNVVKAYHQFKGKGFDILGVSLDRTKEDWLQAIQQDGLAWNHVSDLKYFESQAALDYNINGIPFSILVDPTGVIVAKNLRGQELQRKLSEVLAVK